MMALVGLTGTGTLLAALALCAVAAWAGGCPVDKDKIITEAESDKARVRRHMA